MNAKKCAVLAGLVCLSALQPLSSTAEDLFQLFWRGTGVRTNATGRLTSFRVTEQNFVNEVARNNGLNPATLILVYRPNIRDVAVVQRSNGSFVAGVFHMQFSFTEVVNPTGRVIVRHAFLFDETHEAPLGSFFGTELRRFNQSGAITNDQLTGTALYAKPEQNTVFNVQVSTGRRVFDRTTTSRP